MPALRDVVALAICTFAWGTTWYAITLQLGVVDPVVSLVYRFALAAILLFAWCRLRGEPQGLSPRQHAAAVGLGFFTFAVDYTLIYWAEARVTSAVVAVMFAALAFVNLLLFRLVFGQRAAKSAWLAAGLGVLGVGILSWGELTQAQLSTRTLTGLGMTCGALFAAACGNVFARRGEEAGAPVAAFTAWAMTYGTVFLALYASLTGRRWNFELSLPYVLSLLHLAVIGSVVAFLLYYNLARRRGYSTASYVTALTPPLAMLISALLEDKHWGTMALTGIALVLVGQGILLRGRKT